MLDLDTKMPGRGRVMRESHIVRKMLQDNPHRLFVFGDNMKRVGFGGQAKEMRGEPNAIGIPTKWTPSRDRHAFFTDKDLGNRDVYLAISTAFDRLDMAIARGKDIIFPSQGIGTGRANLGFCAPLIAGYIAERIHALETGNDN